MNKLEAEVARALIKKRLLGEAYLHPEGYDYGSAEAAGMEPVPVEGDTRPHWGTRSPAFVSPAGIPEGLMLKGERHPTHGMGIAGDAGNAFVRRGARTVSVPLLELDPTETPMNITPYGGELAKTPAGKVGGGRIHKVRRDDTLSGIAKEVYGDARKWREIYAANNDKLTSPDRLKPGQTLRLPSTGEEPRPSPKQAPAAKPVPTGNVTVGPIKRANLSTELQSYPAQGFVFHHSVSPSVQATINGLKARGLSGSQYIMDRDGTIYAYAPPGSEHIKPNDEFHGIAPGLSNANAVGMEVVAWDDKDVTPAQVESAKRFISQYYPDTPIYGHGEVNPGHKQPTEGMTIVRAIRAAKRNSEEIGQTVETVQPTPEQVREIVMSTG